MTEQQYFGLPPWHFFLRYVLEALSNGDVLHRRDLQRHASEIAPLTPEQRNVSFPGGERVSEHRAGWAMSALTRAAAVEKPSRGNFKITDVGRQLLAENQGLLTKKQLMALPAWDEYQPTNHQAEGAQPFQNRENDESDPFERIDYAVSEIQQGVAAELLAKLRSGSPEFFERSVLDLLAAMGYGGIDKNITHTGRSGDKGIDGVLDQDELGLNRVHVQAKRYDEGNTVGRPDIQQFIGALGDNSASRGVFVSSSRFSREAKETAEKAGEKIALIDGSKLVELMIRHKVGVQVRKTFTLVEVDEDYFD
jgi:restriction system protein